jgi:hypothetical protein
MPQGNYTQRLEYTILDMIESAARTMKTSPLNLGGVGGAGGGVGGPPGGFIGQLPQTRVAYDTDEFAYSGIQSVIPSGSIVDNLAHIRYRLNVLESGSSITVVDDNEIETYYDTNVIHFSGAGVTVVDLGDGEVQVLITAGSGGSGTPLTVEELDGSPSVTNVDKIIFSGAVVTDLGGGDVLVQIAASGGGSPLVVEEYDGNPSVPNVDKIIFSGATVVDLGSGDVLVQISGWSLGVTEADGNPLVYPTDKIIFSGFQVYDLGSGDALVAASGIYGSNEFRIDQSGGTGDTYGILAGLVNGSNTVYTVSASAYISGSLKVFLNGQLQTQGSGEDWTETSPAAGTFTFVTAPATGDLITASYQKASSTSGNADTVDGYHASSLLIGTQIHSAAEKTTFVVNDEFVLSDSADSYLGKRIRGNYLMDAIANFLAAAGLTPPATTAFGDFQIGDGAGLWIKYTKTQTQSLIQQSMSDYIKGLRLHWVSATAITAKVGAAYIPSLGYIYEVGSDIAKTSLSLSASTWYHVYLYDNSGTPDIEIVTTAPVSYHGSSYQKTGNNTRRYLGSVKTDGSGNIYNFNHSTDDNKISYLSQQDASPFRVLSNGSATTETTVTISTVLPVTARKIYFHATNTNGTFALTFGNSIDSVALPTGYVAAVGAGKDAYIEFPTDTTPAISYAMAGAGGGAYIDVYGYTFER